MSLDSRDNDMEVLSEFELRCACVFLVLALSVGWLVDFFIFS